MKNPITSNLRRSSSRACIKILRRLFSRQMAFLIWVGMAACAYNVPSLAAEAAKSHPNQPTEAPTGFDNLSNGFEEQQAFDKDRHTFEEVETILPETPSIESPSNAIVGAKPRNHRL